MKMRLVKTADLFENVDNQNIFDLIKEAHFCNQLL